MPAQAASPDLSALRYYARSNDLTRVAGEIRRIKAQFPGWSPPDDLFSQEPAVMVDEKPLWDLFASRDFAGIDRLVAVMKAQTPEWTPSKDFESKLELARLRAAVVERSDADDAAGVVEITAKSEGLVSCGDLDLAWRIAEAYAKVDRGDQAIDIYKYILANCGTRAERLATAQKAMQVLADPVAIEPLLALGRKGSDGVNELEPLRTDLLRKRIGDFAADKVKDAPGEAELDAFARSTRLQRSAADAQLLGWFERKRGRPEVALAWFQLAADRDPAPKSLEGLILSLRASDRLAEAETLAFQSRGRSPELRKLFIETVSAALTRPRSATRPAASAVAAPAGKVQFASASDPFSMVPPATADRTVGAPVAPDRLAVFRTDVEAAQSALGAQSLGWYLYNAGGVKEAAFWFQRSLAWGESEEAVLGLALTAKRLKNDRAYRDILARFGARYPAILGAGKPGPSAFQALLPTDVKAPIAAAAVDPAIDERYARRSEEEKRRHKTLAKIKPGKSGWDSDAADITRQLDRGDYDTVLQRLDRRKDRDRLNNGLAVVKGWALFHKGKIDEAKAVFAELDRRGAHKESAEGMRNINNLFIQPRFR